MRLRLLSAALAAGIGLLGAGGGNAAIITATSSLTCSVGDMIVSATACYGTVLPEPTNDSNVDLNQSTFSGITGLFGFTDWTEKAKVDFAGSTGGTNNGLTVGNYSVVNGVATGTWSILPSVIAGVQRIAVVIKQSNTWAAYLYDPAILGGTYSAAAFFEPGDADGKCYNPKNGRERNCADNRGGISHISVYTSGVSQVPLPAAAWLMLAGLGGLGLVARRRTAA
jgi:hypothetical protein